MSISQGRTLSQRRPGKIHWKNGDPRWVSFHPRQLHAQNIWTVKLWQEITRKLNPAALLHSNKNLWPVTHTYFWLLLLLTVPGQPLVLKLNSNKHVIQRFIDHKQNKCQHLSWLHFLVYVPSRPSIVTNIHTHTSKPNSEHKMTHTHTHRVMYPHKASLCLFVWVQVWLLQRLHSLPSAALNWAGHDKASKASTCPWPLLKCPHPVPTHVMPAAPCSRSRGNNPNL